MPFIKGEELEHLRESNRELALQVAELQGQVAVNATVDRIAVEVRQIIESPDFLLPLEQDAEAMAQTSVISEERSRLKSELTASLQESNYDKFAAQFRAEKGDEIREGLDELFKQDGTYASIREKAENDVIVAIQGEVVTAEEARIRAELETPEAIAAQKAGIAERLRSEGFFDEYRSGVRAQLEDRWTTEVHDSVKAEVVNEEEARETEFVASIREGIKTSDWMTRHRRETRSNLERSWNEKTEQQVMDELDDEELNALVAERLQLEQERLSREVSSQKLLTEFEGKGIDVSKLLEGDVLKIYLGNKTTMEVIEKGNYVTAPAILCYRKLTLCGNGDGTFTVDGDSFLDSESIVEREIAALHRGTVITIGRKVTKDGEYSLEQVLRADVPLYYDDDSTDDEIQDSLFSICEVSLNGVLARGIKYTQMAKTKVSIDKK